MSNLGWYQWETTLAKKFGGFPQLGAVILGTGTLIGFSIRPLFDLLSASYKGKNGKKAFNDTTVYKVYKNDVTEEGLSFSVGDQYRILDLFDNVALIEKSNCDNNPYFVSYDFLKSVSNCT